jgi:hypothetical protein
MFSCPDPCELLLWHSWLVQIGHGTQGSLVVGWQGCDVALVSGLWSDRSMAASWTPWQKQESDRKTGSPLKRWLSLACPGLLNMAHFITILRVESL